MLICEIIRHSYMSKTIHKKPDIINLHVSFYEMHFKLLLCTDMLRKYNIGCVCAKSAFMKKMSAATTAVFL